MKGRRKFYSSRALFVSSINYPSFLSPFYVLFILLCFYERALFRNIFVCWSMNYILNYKYNVTVVQCPCLLLMLSFIYRQKYRIHFTSHAVSLTTSSKQFKSLSKCISTKTSIYYANWNDAASTKRLSVYEISAHMKGMRAFSVKQSPPMVIYIFH